MSVNQALNPQIQWLTVSYKWVMEEIKDSHSCYSPFIR